MSTIVFAVGSVLALGCSSADEELGTSGQALTYSYDAYDDCHPERMLAQAPQERWPILLRAARWVLSPVPYSQSDWVDGYRCDCSGFVSMAWENGESFTTHALPPNTSDTSLAYPIDWTELQPGDALNRPGHMRLFAGLSANGELCIWEQASSGTSTLSHAVSAQSLYDSGYQPVRSTRLTSGTSPAYSVY